MPRRKRSADSDLDPVWKALSNPVRRRMLDCLRARPLTTGELAGLFPDYSRFAVMQHLRVLEQGALVIHKQHGRRRINFLNPIPIQEIFHRWVSLYQEPWAESLVALKSTLEEGVGRQPTGKRGRRA
jgi:DNA-binding transcriptional ArsR family regulator